MNISAASMWCIGLICRRHYHACLLAALWPIMLLQSLFAQPLFHASVVFPAADGGYQQVRIPGLVVTQKGTLLAYAEARHSPGKDWSDIDIVLRRSVDGGLTWSKIQVLEDGSLFADQPRNAVAPRSLSEQHWVTCNNPVMICDRSGAIHFLYCVEYNRCFYRVSSDDGTTFGPPVEITDCFNGFRQHYNWKVIATGPGHGIQLSDGRLIVPVWLSLATGRNAHRPSRTAVIYSDDHGKQWNCGGIVPDRDSMNCSESAAVELSDGRLMLNLRNNSPRNRRAVSYSSSGATNWSIPEFVELYEPVCMAGLVRSPSSPKAASGCLLFSNPDPRRLDSSGLANAARQRTNLTIRLSDDDGQTWLESRTIDPNRSGYSDLAVDRDGIIYCLYEQGAPSSLVCARFNLEWIKNKQVEGDRENFDNKN